MENVTSWFDMAIHAVILVTTVAMFAATMTARNPRPRPGTTARRS
jgi:hypothetical protein